MADAPKKGILSKLFGAKNACCCNVTIEEVADEPATAAGPSASNAAGEERPQTPEGKGGNRRSSSCCG